MKTFHAVICKDKDDFNRWKGLFYELGGVSPHHLIFKSPHSFEYNEREYIGIYNIIQLCSFTIDEIITTSEGHKNPNYTDIANLAQANLKERKITESMEELKTIKQKKMSDVDYIALMKAKDWFKQDGLAFIFPNDYVVCEWADFHDGKNSHIEGKRTLGIFHDLNDAEIIYNNKTLEPSQKFPTSAEIHEMAEHYKNLEGPNGPDGSIYVFAGISMVEIWLKERGLL